MMLPEIETIKWVQPEGTHMTGRELLEWLGTLPSAEIDREIAIESELDDLQIVEIELDERHILIVATDLD